MKKLLITLILISPFSFANWGDVYYCQMTTSSGISLEGKKTVYILEKFQFKLDKAKQAMVFGDKGYFSGTEGKLDPNKTWPDVESWYANSKYGLYAYIKGQFAYTEVGIGSGITSITADCDKF